jgi:hypothetical protein
LPDAEWRTHVFGPAEHLIVTRFRQGSFGWNDPGRRGGVAFVDDGFGVTAGAAFCAAAADTDVDDPRREGEWLVRVARVCGGVVAITGTVAGGCGAGGGADTTGGTTGAAGTSARGALAERLSRRRIAKDSANSTPAPTTRPMP